MCIFQPKNTRKHAGMKQRLAAAAKALLGKSNHLHTASETVLQNIFENAVDGIITIDDKGFIESFNPACVKMFGYSPEEVIGKNVKMLMPDPYQREHDQYVKNYNETGHKKIIGIGRQVEAAHKDGSVFPIELAVSEVTAGNRKVYSGFIRSLSQARKAAAEIQQQNDYLTLAEKVAGVGHWRLNLVSNHLYWSQEIYRIHGVSPDHYTPTIKTGVDFYHPEDRGYVEKLLEQALKNGEGFEFKLRIIRPSGEVRYVQSKGQCEIGVKGEVNAIFGVFHDITEATNHEQHLLKKQAEVEEAKSFLSLIMETNTDLIFVKDSSYKIVTANQAFLNLYPKEQQKQVIGYTTLEQYSDEDRDAFLAEDKKAFETGYAEKLETLQFPDSKQRSLLTKKIRFEGANEQVFILCVGRDVTEREELISKLTISNEQLERFAYICSHDLQEPLRTISSFSKKLCERIEPLIEKDEKSLRYMQYITEGTVQATDLIKDILAYSSLDKNMLPAEEVNLLEILNTIEKSFAQALEESGGMITYETLPTIYGNKTQIYQLLQNLINNAIKYQQPEHPPHVAISAEDVGSHWKFRVKDNGIGMEPKHLQKIFDVFQRLHRKGEYSGTGIGLSICKKVVELHGGSIHVESEVGKGSCFTFTLAKLDA